VIAPRHNRHAAKGGDDIGDPRVVGRDDDGIDVAGGGGAPMHVFDHRHAGDERERLAWETRGLVSRRDDGDNSGGANSVREPSRRNDGHGESYTSLQLTRRSYGAAQARGNKSPVKKIWRGLFSVRGCGKIRPASSVYNVPIGAAQDSHHLGANRSSAGFAEENSPGAGVFHKVFHRNC
jgi:hypothetical protein